MFVGLPIKATSLSFLLKALYGYEQQVFDIEHRGVNRYLHYLSYQRIIFLALNLYPVPWNK